MCVEIMRECEELLFGVKYSGRFPNGTPAFMEQHELKHEAHRISKWLFKRLDDIQMSNTITGLGSRDF